MWKKKIVYLQVIFYKKICLKFINLLKNLKHKYKKIKKV